MASMTIRKRVWLLSGLLTANMLVIGGVGYWNSNRLTKIVNELSTNQLPAVRAMTLIDMAHDGLFGTVFSAYAGSLAKDGELLAEAEKGIAEHKESFDSNFSLIMGLKLRSEILEEAAKAQTVVTNYHATAVKIMDTIKAGKPDAAWGQRAEFQTAFGVLEEELEKLGDMVVKDSEATKAVSEEYSKFSDILNIALLVVGLLLSVALSLLVVSKIVSELRRINAALEKNAKNLATAAQEIFTASQAITDASNLQTEAVTDSTSAVTQISSMTQSTAAEATNLSDIARTTDTTVATGQGAIDEMRQSMNTIMKSNDSVATQVEDSNRQIAAIVGVINEIAEKTKVINDIVFQTKLLAFNASVEAARAGEYGRGFAVVAEEVGNLADMSGKAAQEITSKLTESTARAEKILKESASKAKDVISLGKKTVEEGAQTTDRCSSSFSEIYRSTQTLADVSSRISVAVNEQAEGIKRISAAMLTANNATIKTNQSAKQTSQIASSLLEEARSLNESVKETAALIEDKKKAA